MASIGHIAVATATGRAFGRSSTRMYSLMFFLSFLSYLPDFDVIGFQFGIAYGDEWGHRGATHSIVFAVFVGLLSGFLGKYFQLSFWKMAIISILLVATHGALDAMTDGGKGIALLWPFDNTRYFFPWRFIPVAPIGFSFFSSWGWKVFSTEVMYFSPLLIYSCIPRFKKK